jgi:hypothetical protein
MFMNSGTRGNKIGVMGSLSFSPPPPPSTLSRKTRGSPRRVKQGGFKKSFGINNRHLLGKGEKTVVKKKSEKDSRVIERWDKKSIFGKRHCKNVRMQSGRKKEDWKDFSKLNAGYFV